MAAHDHLPYLGDRVVDKIAALEGAENFPGLRGRVQIAVLESAWAR
jgi:hypothetical protein